jgi:hypothetical protein
MCCNDLLHGASFCSGWKQLAVHVHVQVRHMTRSAACCLQASVQPYGASTTPPTCLHYLGLHLMSCAVLHGATVQAFAASGVQLKLSQMSKCCDMLEAGRICGKGR